MQTSSSPSSRSRSGRRCSAALLACGLALAACSSKSDVPPRIQNHAPTAPLACGALADGGAAQDGLVVIDGAPANCAADGMVCPLAKDVVAPAQCGSARVIAVCQQTRWVVSCGDAGTAPADAGAD